MNEARRSSPLVVIAGETASGKTALAIELARKLDGEIICADSWTVYRDFTIGTAKPSINEQSEVPHHLLDIVDPHDGFSAAVFQRLAYEKIADITMRNRLPIVVGGTGLYIDSLLFSYSFMPQSDPRERAQYNQMSLDELLGIAARQGVDTSVIDHRNKRRVIRLLENGGKLPTRQPLRDRTYTVGIQWSIDQLEQRIIARVQAMLGAGLVKEVVHLGERYGWDCEPMKAPGYRAVAAYLHGDMSYDTAIHATIRQHMQLAKKQRTWFQRNKDIHWLKPDYKLEDVMSTINQTLYK